MEFDSIRESIRNLGKADFDKLVMCIVKSYLNLHPLNVDGHGDGGLEVTRPGRIGGTRCLAC